MTTRKILVLSLCLILLLLIPACNSPKLSPLQDWDDLFSRLLSEDGQSFQVEVPWYSSEADILQFGDWTKDDVTSSQALRTSNEFLLKPMPFEKMNLSYQTGYLLQRDRLRVGLYRVDHMTAEDTAAFCAALEKWAADIPYTPSVSAKQFSEWVLRLEEHPSQNSLAEIVWTDKNGYTLTLQWQVPPPGTDGARVTIRVIIPSKVFLESIG